MAYEYKGIKCDTYEELQRVMTMNNQSAASPRPSIAPMSEERGHCYNPNHRDDCEGRKSSCASQTNRCCSKDGDCWCDRFINY